MTRRTIHVVIIGAGLGDLCLAQGLRQHGISFDVYERGEAADSRTQGYRIRIDEKGQWALAACLTPELNPAVSPDLSHLPLEWTLLRSAARVGRRPAFR